MRSRTAEDLLGRCPRCRLRIERCLCDAVEPVETPLRFVVVRHALESLKSTNTARLATLALPDVEVREHGREGEAIDLGDLDPESSMLVFPSGSASPPPNRLPSQLVVLDGNWNQVRRMLGRFPELRGLPKLSLPAPAVAPRRVRHAPLPHQLSTIEAMAGALRWCGDESGARKLERLYGTFVARTLASRGL